MAKKHGIVLRTSHMFYSENSCKNHYNFISFILKKFVLLHLLQ